MLEKDKNDITDNEAQMSNDTETRCGCWEFDRKGRPLSESTRNWRMDVMADSKGFCKHCRQKMTKYWPIKKPATATQH